MHFNRVRVSSRTQGLLSILKTRTGLTPNITSRFAICLSLREPSIPNADEFDEKGMELHPAILFGEYERFFLALILDRLHRDKLDPQVYLHRQLRAHLNRGVYSLFPRIHDLSDFYELVRSERQA